VVVRLARQLFVWISGWKYQHGGYRQQLADWHVKAERDGWKGSGRAVHSAE
jgi:hypothetical protein